MCDRRRVLFQPCYFLPERWNGMDEHLLLLTKYLDRSRFELLLLVHPDDGPQSQILAERADLRVVAAPYPVSAGALARVLGLRSLYRRERIDLLHVHSPAAAGHTIPALAARLARVSTTIVTYHQVQAWRFPARTRAINYLAHTALIDKVVAVSAGVRDTAVASAGIPQRGIIVIHNGIELLETGSRPDGLPEPAPGEILIGYFGRLSPEKGVSLLLQAIARLARTYPQARLLIVGDGPERGALEQAAADPVLTDRVRFLGFRPDARRIMEHVDIIVHAPVYEGFGLVVIEAMAAGKPVVVNDAPGGLPDIVVPGETGVIVPAGSPAALAEAIAGLVADPQERARLGRNGRARCAQHFSARDMSGRIAQLYGSTRTNASADRRAAEVGHF